MPSPLDRISALLATPPSGPVLPESRRAAMRILVHGQVTDAYVTASDRTKTQFNINIEFDVQLTRADRPDDPPLKMSKSDPTVVAFARERLESKQPVFVLFDPKRPNRALLPEVL